MNAVLRLVNHYTLPVAMAAGAGLYALFASVPSLGFVATRAPRVVNMLFPATLFITLFTTFARVDFSRMRPRRWHLALLAVQTALVALLVAAIRYAPSPSTHILLESLLTCAIAPCAAAAPVVTSQLGGDLASMATYLLIASLFCTLTIPAVFPLVEPDAGIPFWTAALAILQRLAAVMLLPLLGGWAVRHCSHSTYEWIQRHPRLSFHTWCLSLMMISGLTVRNIVHAPFPPLTVVAIALGSLLVCLLHYAIGHLVGRHMPEPINIRQGAFQKNTALAIYISSLYLHPVASIGAGCYVLWQNIVNAYELRPQGKNTH